MSFIIQEQASPVLFKIAKKEAKAAGGDIDFLVADQDVLFYANAASSDFSLNVTYDAGTTLNDALNVDDDVTIKFISTNLASAHSLDQLTIDGAASGIDFYWASGWPSAGVASSTNIIELEIIKTSDNEWTIIGSRETYDLVGAIPSQPTGASATVIDNENVLVAFDLASGGSLGVDLYTVISNPSGITAASATSPITIGGLTSAIPYTFTVYAENQAGISRESEPSNAVTPETPAGQQAYTTPGTYSWVAPPGVTVVSAVAIGGASTGSGVSPLRGGSGGGLGWKNNIAVVPGNSYTVVVGAAGANYSGAFGGSNPGAASYFVSSGTVQGNGGVIGNNAGFTGDGGGNGGRAPTTDVGAGGAGGYSGAGGDGVLSGSSSGAGGAGGGSRVDNPSAPNNTRFGGGTGILGEGASGTTGGGGNGTQGSTTPSTESTVYGGGGAGFNGGTSGFKGGDGAVRIIWAGGSGIVRAFPSTNTGDL